jgi:hypothetical protein
MKKILFLIFLLSFIIFLPSLFTFYTHDDFFLLKISNAESLGEFVNFFNFTKGPEGLGMYRPLTTQVFYFLGNSVFNLNPLPLHIISFIAFFLIIYLVYRLVKILTGSEGVASISAFLYAVSATHFGHLYYLATFQELGLAVFFLLSVLFFIEFISKKGIKYLTLSLIAFVLSLLSKETAIVIPGILVLVYGFFKKKGKKICKPKSFFISLIPFLIILAGYLYFHFFVYGLAQGESYIWDFSPRVINTLFWYGLWSLNLPEMLVDFVGPGLKFNPNLFKFWSADIIPILAIFVVVVALLLFLVLKVKKDLKDRGGCLLIFGFLWFLITLLPVVFLPLHKFTFYLTLPLFGVVLIISYLLEEARVGRLFKLSFLSLWLIISLLTLRLTISTHWITQGSSVARNTLIYFSQLEQISEEKEFVEFYDTQDDSDLPWSPSNLVKVVLSQNNFFEVFFKERFELLGEEIPAGENIVKIRARGLLNY